MKILLLIIPLLFGCAREFTCDAGEICLPSDVETEYTYATGTECSDIRITVDWPDGEKEAEEICDESYTIGREGSKSSCSCSKAD